MQSQMVFENRGTDSRPFSNRDDAPGLFSKIDYLPLML